jgi:hypothetical protein
MMSETKTLINPSKTMDSTPRARRGAAAVFAQYIQDLTHPSEPDPCAAAA